MIEIAIAVLTLGFIVSVYCYSVYQDNKNIQTLLKKIEEEHENESNRD